MTAEERLDDLDSRVLSWETWDTEWADGIDRNKITLNLLVALLFILVAGLLGAVSAEYREILNLDKEVNLLMHAQFDYGSNLI